jgi:hypothetical protein
MREDGSWQLNVHLFPRGHFQLILLAVDEGATEMLLDSIRLGQPLEFSSLPSGTMALSAVRVAVGSD